MQSLTCTHRLRKSKNKAYNAQTIITYMKHYGDHHFNSDPHTKRTYGIHNVIIYFLSLIDSL